MSKKDNSYCIGFLTLIQIIIVFGLFATVIVPLLKYQEFEEGQCNITHISYPIDLPSSNNTNNWKTCDCGRHCNAWTTCIKLYSSINPNVVIQKDFYKESNNGEECTFYENKCSNGENIILTQEKLNEAKHIFETYNNKNVNCFYNKNEIYLNHEFNTNRFIILITLFSIISCCCGIQLFIYYDCKCDYKYNKKQQFDSSINIV